ncbi:MAG: hypothetical protein GXP14_14845 [Gammaproteobacteria bacterium]|nr:hypothetical protein [Gammaproteobacteria bacterium]
MKNNAFNHSIDTKHLNEQIRSLLLKFNREISKIEASAVISRDGFTLAAVLGNNIDTNRSGALCASLLALAETAAKEFKRGKLNQVMLDCDHGFVIVIHIGSNAALVIISQEKINLGMLFFSAQKAAKQIESILDPLVP